MAATAVTPVGVRDGDPDALAGLCDRRGPAVLAYCEVVAGHGQAGVAAAAEAFASFRLGVVAAPDLANLHPEALLISATRHAAARIAGLDAPEGHADVPALLAARADRSITLAEHDWLEEHLASCWTCRAPVARFEAADRTYRDPPSTPLAPEVSALIVAAMAAAAPVRGAEVEPPAAEINVNGSVAHAGAAEAGPHAAGEPGLESAGYVEQPTAAWQIGEDDLDLAEHGRIEDEAEDEAAAARRERRSASRESRRGITRRPRAERSGKQRGAAADRAAPKAGAARGARSARPSRAERIAAAPAAAAAAAAAAAEGAEETEFARGSGRGTSLPRPRRTVGSAGGASRRARSGPRAGVVLPIALVVLAIIVALLIAGVFGGGEPESSPQSFAPAPAESTDADAPVVVVPGAASAGAAAVERAKAKARAARRREAELKAAGDATPADSPTALPTPATTPPPAPAAGDDGQTTSSPADDEDTGSGGAAPKIDAGKDATGAEQVPGTPDTSTVPELAPPAESADPPPG